MRSFNVHYLEETMHDKLADYFAKAAQSNPKMGKLGACTVGLITLATHPLFALASLVESMACFLFNLLGAAFSVSCRRDLGESLVNLVFNLINTSLCPLTTFSNSIGRASQMAKSPKVYKAKTELQKQSLWALQNNQVGLPLRKIGNKSTTPIDPFIQKIVGNVSLTGKEKALINRIPVPLWKKYDKWLETQSNRTPDPIVQEFVQNITVRGWDKLKEILQKGQEERVKQLLKTTPSPFDKVD